MSRTDSCFVVDGADPDTVRDVTAFVEPLLSAVPYASLDHDVRFLLKTVSPPSKLRFIVAEEGGRAIGFAPVITHPGSISFLRVGDVPVLSRRIERHDIIGGPLIGACGSKEQRVSCLGDMFRTLRREMSQRSAIFLFGAPHELGLHELPGTKSPLCEEFHVVPYGPAHQRRLISFTGTYEDYLKSLGKITRKDLRRTRRKVSSALDGVLDLRVFRTLADVPVFMKDATVISEKTHQWNLYGDGLREGEQLSTLMDAAAKNGWFRSYILYIKSQPVAFQVGYLHRGTYYAFETGYDPHWAKLQIGIFLLTEIFADLVEAPEAVNGFDFLQGDDLHKSRLSNRSREERNFYLIPRGVHGALSAYPLKASLALSDGLGHLVDRFGAGRRGIKRFLRRASIRSRSAD